MITPDEIRGSKQIRFDVFAPSGAVKKFMVNRLEKAGDPPTFFLAHLTTEADPGFDPQRRFFYVGKVNGLTGEVLLTQQSTYPDGHVVVQTARRALEAIFGENPLPVGFRVDRHEKSA